MAEILGELPATIGEDDNLIELGMDSIRMMTLAGAHRTDGTEVSFADLATNPTLSAWRMLLDGPGAPAVEREAGDEPDDQAPFELAPMQHAYWIGRGESQVLGGVGAHFYHEFDGPGVEPARLERAVEALFRRHDMLRVRVGADGHQRIAALSWWPGLVVHDLRSRRATYADRALQRLRDDLSHRLLDLSIGEVFDVQLSQLPDGRSRIHVNLEMLVADALSFRILLGDLAELYK